MAGRVEVDTTLPAARGAFNKALRNIVARAVDSGIVLCWSVVVVDQDYG